MKKKAIAYVNDIILGSTGEVIGRGYQKEMIRQYALENNIEIETWFEDEVYEEDVLCRPGIKQFLDYKGTFHLLLVERVWSLSRNWRSLQALFSEMEYRKINLECATTMWDCVSQMSRHRFNETLHLATHKRAKCETVENEKTNKIRRGVAIKQPKKLHFARMTQNKTYVTA